MERSRIDLPAIGIFFLYGSSDRAAPVRAKVESAAVQGLVKMVSLDWQRTEHRLSNLALIAPSPIRSTANPAAPGRTGIAQPIYKDGPCERANLPADEVEGGTAVPVNAAVQ
jgi:hypothetical protein